MKKAILYIILSSLVGCYTKSVFDEHGTYTNKTSIFKYPRHQSYSNDHKLIKGVYLNSINDTISKRCFSALEINNLKKVLSKNKIEFTDLVINKSKFLKNPGCVGIYFVSVSSRNRINYETIPVLKFEGEFVINTVYVEGLARHQDSVIVLRDIARFRSEYKSRFDDTTLLGISENYKYGTIKRSDFYER